jgi:hypothetical protein
VTTWTQPGLRDGVRTDVCSTGSVKPIKEVIDPIPVRVNESDTTAKTDLSKIETSKQFEISKSSEIR